jgi:predicted AAA+ superfamily ATPase
MEPFDEIIPVLSGFNPWWRGERFGMPPWKRHAFKCLHAWVEKPPVSRAVFVSGARQTGKTTLLLQVIEALLQAGVPESNILFATFDHPVLKMAGLDRVLAAWREREARVDGCPEYIFLDELQCMKGWETWVKHQTDFRKDRHIVFTGSALSLLEKGAESGPGRWTTVPLETLSFREYLQIRNMDLPELSCPDSLETVFGWPESAFWRLRDHMELLTSRFHQYLVQGGFPQTAPLDDIAQAQRLLREDVVDKVLKRDMTALFGVRHVLEMERLFLWLCRHEGILDPGAACSRLGVNRNTLQSYLKHLESCHLVRILRPFGYGKEILKSKYKVYLTDMAVGSAVFLRGASVLEDEAALGGVVETAVLKHLVSGFLMPRPAPAAIFWWRGASKKLELEVDFVLEAEGTLLPFEVKYRRNLRPADERGIQAFCEEKNLARACMVTRAPEHFGVIKKDFAHVLQIPASLFCLWSGSAEGWI